MCSTALCLQSSGNNEGENPLLIKLDSKLHRIKVRHNTTKTTAVAYADDITIFITHPSEIDEIKVTLHEYM